ncbi:MAG: hypothetical protein P1V20_10625 [Verrucomicrobiales bacterium]|nr:hypothetical protein [Verrucomicrobiales bacterium]
MDIELKKKQYFQVSNGLWDYLGQYGRTFDFPSIYEDLHRFSQLFPLFDREGNDTLWKSCRYDDSIREGLKQKLTKIYSLLKTGDHRVVDHLDLQRVDYCEFGNSRPFRIRIVNLYNDNYDNFYVKVADSSRIYGLELEHILSPNRINYLANGNTLIEEHIAGVPGDNFIRDYFDREETNRVRIAKEFVKFNERCFIRLLGDMRSYNYVVDITPDFEEVQYRVRAIDFDQQSYEGRKEMYLPQFFEENKPVVDLCTSHLNYQTMNQYRDEERTLISRRVHASSRRLNFLWDALVPDEISTQEKIIELRDDLNNYHSTDVFNHCETMGALVKQNVEFSLAQTASERF